MEWDVCSANTYFDNRSVWNSLQSQFRLPKRIRTDKQFAQAEEMMGKLEYRRGDTPADRRYFSLLSALIDEYENRTPYDA